MFAVTRRAAKQARVADLAFGLVFSFVCSSAFQYIREPNPERPAKRPPLPRIKRGVDESKTAQKAKASSFASRRQALAS
jgi:hypothetical protein